MDSYSSAWTDLLRLPFRQEWVDVDGIRTRMWRAGPRGAPAMIMLAGTGGHVETFSRNLASLAEHFDCYAIDKLGHGFTDKPDHDYEIVHYVEHVRAFMDVMKIEQASFFGVSLGAWVATRFAVTYPARAERLTLISAPGIFAHAPAMSAIKSVRSNAVDDPSWENVSSIFNDLLLHPENCPPDIIAVRQAIYRQPEMKRAMKHILALQQLDIRSRNLISEEEWRGVRSPTLFIGAVDHPDQYLDTARIASKWMPDARYVEMSNVGHWPHFEDPDTFNPIHLAFLLETQAAARP